MARKDKTTGKEKPRRRKGDPKPPRSLSGFFLRGLMTVLPVGLTIVIFGLLVQMVDRYVTGPINDGIYWSLEHNGLGWRALDRMGIDPFAQKYLKDDELPMDIRDDAAQLGLGSEVVKAAIAAHREQHLTFFRKFDDLAIDEARLRADVARVVHPLVGVLISLLVVLWLGWLVGSFVGRRIIQRLDDAMHVIPVVKSVYPYSKQLVEFFFAEKSLEFDSVVIVPYPSPGLWSLAFVTGRSLRTLREQTERRWITCFVPSSPMPMTGYTIFVEADRVIPLKISVDQALRITMSGGVIVPPSEMVDDPDAEDDAPPPLTIEEPDLPK